MSPNRAFGGIEENQGVSSEKIWKKSPSDFLPGSGQARRAEAPRPSGAGAKIDITNYRF
jgi:hypothetical protein